MSVSIGFGLTVAAISLEEIGRNIGGNAQDLQASAELIAAFVGVCMVIVGLMKMVYDNNLRQSKTIAIGLIVVGSLMFGIGTVSYMVLSSMVGDEALEEFEESYGIL